MNQLTIPLSISCLSFLSLISISNHAGGNSATKNPATFKSYHYSVADTCNNSTINAADYIYDSLVLKQYGLSKQAWDYAFKGYEKLVAKKDISNPDIITVCDFSLSSRRKRLLVVDIKNYKVLLNTYVAHGRKSGNEYANKFSNKANSHQSSIGFYVTGNPYYGEHGLALKIEGVDAGFNDKAQKRNIVIHGSEYVGDQFLEHNRFMGRSFGCPAVPKQETATIINTIKNGSCFFIYYPAKQYLKSSKILNG